MTTDKYRNISLDSADGQSMMALINGDRGWLMYLRCNGDAGFSSRNLKYAGPASQVIEFALDNGQVDEYPASWALPLEVVERALKYFQNEAKPAPFVFWENDSGDGMEIEFIASN